MRPVVDNRRVAVGHELIDDAGGHRGVGKVDGQTVHYFDCHGWYSLRWNRSFVGNSELGPASSRDARGEVVVAKIGKHRVVRLAVVHASGELDASAIA
jgi:hypothetical protein